MNAHEKKQKKAYYAHLLEGRVKGYFSLPQNQQIELVTLKDKSLLKAFLDLDCLCDAAVFKLIEIADKDFLEFYLKICFFAKNEELFLLQTAEESWPRGYSNFKTYVKHYYLDDPAELRLVQSGNKKLFRAYITHHGIVSDAARRALLQNEHLVKIYKKQWPRVSWL